VLACLYGWKAISESGLLLGVVLVVAGWKLRLCLGCCRRRRCGVLVCRVFFNCYVLADARSIYMTFAKICEWSGGNHSLWLANG
jgi:hypothetical protein